VVGIAGVMVSGTGDVLVALVFDGVSETVAPGLVRARGRDLNVIMRKVMKMMKVRKGEERVVDGAPVLCIEMWSCLPVRFIGSSLDTDVAETPRGMCRRNVIATKRKNESFDDGN
jgi:hypothetical protein